MPVFMIGSTVSLFKDMPMPIAVAACAMLGLSSWFSVSFAISILSHTYPDGEYALSCFDNKEKFKKKR